MKYYFLGLIFLICTSALYAEPQEWYKLEDGERYVTDFSLPAKQSKVINIDSTHPINVGFSTDVAFAPDRSEQYDNLKEKYRYSVIKLLDHNGNGNAMSTIYGGSMKCHPSANGKIIAEVFNLTDQEFKVVIYKKDIHLTK